jgi:anthranilate phosphoribosyltransferase
MIQEAIEILSQNIDLTAAQMEAVMEEIMTGKVDTGKIVSFLTNLNKKGEAVEELTAAVQVMRRHATKIKTKHKVILDTCGTGGDGKYTFNISTAAAFIVSGAGITVAKHGNRCVSSKSGSADILEALGININMAKEKIEKCLDEIGIAFLFAQNFHPAMKYAMPARKEMVVRTIFNFLGPLSNPAGATHQLLGVYDPKWAKILAQALNKLGTRHALVVRGMDGLDEITTTDKTLVWEVSMGGVSEHSINYADFGFKKASLSDFSGGQPLENANLLLEILNNKPGPLHDIVVLNAAAAIYAARDLIMPLKQGIQEGIKLAEESLRTKSALRKLELLKDCSNK